MAARKIEIQMVAAGGDAAAAEVKKTTDSVKGLTEATEQHATAAKQDTQINLDRARVFAEVGQAVAQASGALANMANDVRRDAPDMAGKLDLAAKATNSLGSAANGAAQGFAVGGPFGAAIGALVGATLPSLKSALDDMVGSLAGAEAAQNRLAESGKKLAEAQARAPAFEWARTAADLLDGAAESAGRLAEAIRQAKVDAGPAEAVAKLQAEAADQAAIDAGADPFEVRRARVRSDAQQKRDALTNNSRALVATSQEAANQVDGAADKAAGFAATLGPDAAETKAAEKALADAKKALAAALREQADDARNAPNRRLEIDLEERKELGRLDAADLAADQASALSNARGGLNTTAAQRVGFFNAFAATARTPGERGAAPAMQQIGKALADGTDAAEIQRLQQQFVAATQGLGGATVASLAKMLEALQEQARKVTTMEQQIKNLRKPGA